jgi:hypothetical protein
MRPSTKWAALLVMAALTACGSDKPESAHNGPGEAGTQGGTPGAPVSGAPQTQAGCTSAAAAGGATLDTTKKQGSKTP